GRALWRGSLHRGRRGPVRRARAERTRALALAPAHPRDCGGRAHLARARVAGDRRQPQVAASALPHQADGRAGPSGAGATANSWGETRTPDLTIMSRAL